MPITKIDKCKLTLLLKSYKKSKAEKASRLKLSYTPNPKPQEKTDTFIPKRTKEEENAYTERVHEFYKNLGKTKSNHKTRTYIEYIYYPFDD